MKQLKWTVFYHDINRQEITTFNIFNHYGFNTGVQKILKNIKDKDEFTEKLRRELMYYFWCKAEYEIIISPWCGGKKDTCEKIDIYTQVMNNFDIFVDYVWNSKQHRKTTTKSKSTKSTKTKKENVQSTTKEE